MTEIPERDRGLLGLVERLIKRPEPAAAAKRAAAPPPEVAGDLDLLVSEAPPQESLEPQIAVETTRTLSSDQLADVILRALKSIDGCPPDGFEITVYGRRPWNAMLRITPAAGRLQDAAIWRRRVQDMVPPLRNQFELSE